MDKRKINFLDEVLSEISANFEGVENFIKEKIEEICSRKKDSSRGSNFFSCFIFSLMKICVFLVIVCCLLAFSIKSSCLL